MREKYHIDEKGFALDLILAVKANSKSGKALDPPEMIFFHIQQSGTGVYSYGVLQPS